MHISKLLRLATSKSLWQIRAGWLDKQFAEGNAPAANACPGSLVLGSISLPNQHMNPLPLSRCITGEASRKLMNEREASGPFAARVIHDRCAI
jgi:hypothetical protein